MIRILSASAALILALGASPALAQTAAAIPEPADAALFALGVIGLIVGRQAARRRRD